MQFFCKIHIKSCKGHSMLIFLIICIKKGIVCRVLCARALIFFTLLLSKFIMSTYLNHYKIKVNFIFAVNFGTIYLLDFQILTKGIKINEKKKRKDYM